MRYRGGGRGVQPTRKIKHYLGFEAGPRAREGGGGGWERSSSKREKKLEGAKAPIKTSNFI